MTELASLQVSVFQVDVERQVTIVDFQHQQVKARHVMSSASFAPLGF